MWIPEDAEEVQIDCRECGEIFSTSDPLTILCDTCTDWHLEHDHAIRADRSENVMRGEYGGC